MKKDIHENWIKKFEEFFAEYKRKPVASISGTKEYNIARAYDIEYSPKGKRRKELSSELENRLQYLEHQPEWKRRATPAETVVEAQVFCAGNAWFPVRKSPDSYESGLAARIAQKKRFTAEQQEIIQALRKKYPRNHGVSFPEKIFYQILYTVLGEKVSANRQICGYEADISFRYKENYIIQYDGKAFHKKEENISLDKTATAAHLKAGNRVFRLREQGLPSLNEDKEFSDQVYWEIEIAPNKFTEENVNQVIEFIFEKIGYNKKYSYEWGKVIQYARYDASSRKTAVRAVCEYLEHILVFGETPLRNSAYKGDNGVRLDMRIKMLLQRDRFEDRDKEALALLEAFYESKNRKRNQKAFMEIGNKLDFEKGSQFVK